MSSNSCNNTDVVSISKQHQFGMHGPRTYNENTQVALAAIDNAIAFSHVNSTLTWLIILNMAKKLIKEEKMKLINLQN